MPRPTPRRTLLAALALALPTALLQLVTTPPAQAVSPDVVISQVYGAGGNTGATLRHDFVEVYNRGASPVDLTGWSVQYASATGTGTFASNSPVSLTGTLPPGEHYLVQLAGGANGTALPTPDATGTIAMAAGSGKVVAVRPGATVGLACNGGSDPCDAAELARIADLVGYGGANFFETAPAPTLSSTTAALRAADGATDTDDNAADFAVGAPNPRACGAACVPPPPVCDPPPTHEIAEIQGSGTSTPLAGQCVRTEGIVTGDFNGTGGLGGFYLQDDTPDSDPATSDGLFVVSTAEVSAGDRVRVDGTAAEGFGETQLTDATVSVIGTGVIAPAPYDLPRPVGTTFEPVEGVLLTFPEELTATEHFQLGRFGEVAVSSGGRLLQPTDVVAPGAAAQAMLAENQRRRLLVDDGSTVQNPQSVPHLEPHAVRIGDTTSGITGVLGYGFGSFRLQPTAPLAFTSANPRPPAPADVGGDVTVASFNTLNYFTTLTTENPDARGANSLAEFARQQAKEVAAITSLDADVVGLMEIENNGPTAVASLVQALNDATAPGTYAYVTEPVLNGPNDLGGTFGTDAIKVALIYQPAAVTPVGTAQTSADPVFDRPPLIQTFAPVDGGAVPDEEFTVVVNHFKSKSCGSSPPAIEADQGDGQGCFNHKRLLQAQALASHLDTQAVSNALVIGDLNSYTEEDPIHALEDAGYTGLTGEFMDPADRYSYVFDGFSGELDHAMADADLVDNVTGATIWHINADEPLVLDYNLDFGRDPAIFEPNAYRASDHDPVVVGLELSTFDFGGFTGAVQDPPAVNVVKAGSAVPVEFSLGGFQGLDVLAEGSPTVSAYSCATGVPTDPADGVPAQSRSGLTYDAATDTYTYVWKTQKGWADSCRHLVVEFVDGMSYTADFRFR